MRLTAPGCSPPASGHSGQHVGGELLVAEDGQAFLQRQLEPVAAGDAVAGPVVEILVRDHGLDVLVVDVGGGVRAGQQMLELKMFSPLFSIAPMLKSETATIMKRRGRVRGRKRCSSQRIGADQRFHRVFGTVEARRHVQICSSTSRPEIVWMRRSFTSRSPATSATGRRACGRGRPRARSGDHRAGRPGDQVAVGQQHRAGLVGFQRDGEARHHVRAIRVPGDAAETLCLALGEKAAARGVEAGERGVFSGATRVTISATASSPGDRSRSALP